MSVSLVRPILLDLLDRRADARAVDRDQVLAIANSMVDVGQINPIRVRYREFDGRYEIVAGVHRVEACRSLGLVEVDALIVESGDLFAELAMIDENLCRAELGPADRARQTARRKAIYEEIHPETQHGTNQHDRSRQVGDSSPRFTTDTASATGASERSVQRDAARGERIRDEALDAVAGTDLDTGVFLDELKQLDPDEQLGHVRHRLNGERAIAARRLEPADSLDYFPTPPWATRALIELVLPMLGRGPFASKTPGTLGRLWEPACGEGHMSGVLAEYSDDVVATDIAGYGSAEGSPPGWIGRHDFLDPAYAGPTPPADWIITNPPFGELSLAFALRALGLAQQGVALFVRQQWLEGVTRYGELFSKHPPALVAQFAERVNLKKGEWDPDGDTLTSYCWVVWTKGDRCSGERSSREEARDSLKNGDTLLMWIPPGQRVALSRADDVERFTAHPVRVPAAAAIILPASGPADEARAANAGATGEATAAAVSPVSGPSLTSVEIDQLIIDGYAAGGPDLVRRLAEATGLSREAVRQRASRLAITSADNQRAAALRVINAVNAARDQRGADGPPERLATSPERGADGPPERLATSPERGAEGASDAEG